MVTTVNSENFNEEVLQAKTPVLIDFWAVWCGPCRMMTPVVDEIAEEMGTIIKVCKVNIDENPDLATRFQIMSIPTFISIKDGKEVGRIIGAQSKEELLKIL